MNECCSRPTKRSAVQTRGKPPASPGQPSSSGLPHRNTAKSQGNVCASYHPLSGVHSRRSADFVLGLHPRQGRLHGAYHIAAEHPQHVKSNRIKLLNELSGEKRGNTRWLGSNDIAAGYNTVVRSEWIGFTAALRNESSAGPSLTGACMFNPANVLRSTSMYGCC
jgi:hypothetical protein